MINSVNVCSNEYRLYINLLKTKIVIFRNRGHVKAEEKWFLNGNKIDVCNEFMYLFSLNKTESSAYVSKNKFSDFNSYD
jgi:hypothetical protein